MGLVERIKEADSEGAIKEPRRRPGEKWLAWRQRVMVWAKKQPPIQHAQLYRNREEMEKKADD